MNRTFSESCIKIGINIDPSCGTGTFLIHYMNYVQKIVDKKAIEISNGDTDISSFIAREMQGENSLKWVKDYVFGIDNDMVLATACQINQILHGDGSTNIYFADGLDKFGNYSNLDVVGSLNLLSAPVVNEDYYSKNCINKFDIVISNPPFNVNVNKNNLENSFELNGKSEAYFLERWYQLLKPKGRIGVVLPESFFSVEEDHPGRVFLYKHFNLKCIVSLPPFAFSPHTTTNTSLLFAEKKSKEEEVEYSKELVIAKKRFLENYNSVLSFLPMRKKDVDFLDSSSDNYIKKLVLECEKKLNYKFGENFMIFPYFTDDFLCISSNYGKIKKEIKNLMEHNKERWVLHQISARINNSFVNYCIDEIGYKAGKKGSKEKPNELMKIMDADGNQIYDLKFSHTWDKIENSEMDTVLGMISEVKIWQ